MADKLYLGIMEHMDVGRPKEFRLVSPARGGFAPVTLDQSAIEAIADEASEYSSALREGAIRPEILAIEEGSTKNHNVYGGKFLMGGKADEDGNPSGVASWYSPFAKPILVNHDMSVDPLGRIQSSQDARAVRIGGKVRVLIYPTITQPEAVGKMLRGEYLTGSIGVLTDSAKCSICGHDIIAEGELCDHWKGRRYNKAGKPDPKGEPAEWLLGNLWNQEYSMVNQPARYNSGILKVNTKEFVEYLRDGEVTLTSEQTRKTVCHNCHGDCDSHDCKGDGKCKSEAPTEAFYIVRMSERHRYWMPGMGTSTTKEASDMLIPALDTVEAKLSYANRQKLPDSAFCGPGRTYPAHDAAHVRNGLARLSQFGGKLSSSVRAKILACLRSRAKKYGIKVGGKSELFMGDDAVKEFDAMAEQLGLSEDLKAIVAMDEKAMTQMLEKTWVEADVEREELKAEEAFLTSLPAAAFVGPERSFPVPNETYAQVARAILSWPSTMEKITREQRTVLLGKVEQQESLFDESGTLKDVKVEFPAWAESDDYVSAAVLMEQTLHNCISGLKRGEAQDKAGDGSAAGSQTETCPSTQDVNIEGVSEQAIAQLTEQLVLSQEQNKALKTENATLQTQLGAKDQEIEKLQEMNVKLGADKHKDLVEQAIKLRKDAGDKRTDEELQARYGALSLESLQVLLEEMNPQENSSVTLPGGVKPAVQEGGKLLSGPGVKVDNAGGQPSADAAKAEKHTRFARVAAEVGAIEGPKDQD
ncbi:MAG: hypothetical protein WC712_13345 [Candidatus Brocadiia bacterium]